MRLTILVILFLSINCVFGQNIKVEYHELIPEYSIEQMELNLRTKNYEIHFLTSGYNFENQLEFLQRLSINEKLHIIEK